VAKKNKKTSFNQNLYEKNKYDPAKDNSHNDKVAYFIYRVCAVMFAIMMIISYAQQDIQKATLYLIFLCVAVYLIFVYHRKAGK